MGKVQCSQLFPSHMGTCPFPAMRNQSIIGGTYVWGNACVYMYHVGRHWEICNDYGDN